MSKFLEIINSQYVRGGFKACVFDFDGTISLIREGWQQVMIPYFVRELTENTNTEYEIALGEVTEFVDLLTGKQTIYQCIRLAEIIAERGGQAKDPLEYKKGYNDLLMDRISHRIQALKTGKTKPGEMVVPGTFQLLDMLKSYGLVMYLASGTDEEYVIEEASLLGVDSFFDGGIYGARDQYKLFSKAMVIKNILSGHNLSGNQLLGFGDGYVEIENIKDAGGFSVGVASDEKNRSGVDQWKRTRLINAGAHIIIPDYVELETLREYIFPR